MSSHAHFFRLVLRRSFSSQRDDGPDYGGVPYCQIFFDPAGVPSKGLRTSSGVVGLVRYNPDTYLCGTTGVIVPHS